MHAPWLVYVNDATKLKKSIPGVSENEFVGVCKIIRIAKETHAFTLIC